MLEKFRKARKSAFIPFIVSGDPTLDVTERMIDVLVEEGADFLELGVPFSDALADGPVIQAASERASRKVSLLQVLEMASRVHFRHPQVPLILFTYYNPILQMGLEHFARQARASGIAAVLVVDLPPEEAVPYLQQMKEAELKTVFLASPTTSSERLRQISEISTGFMYVISRAGVTGVQNNLSSSLENELEQVKSITERPFAVGFGISNGEQARWIADRADAVVVGSAFVRLISSYPANPEEVEKKVRDLAAEIRKALRG